MPKFFGWLETVLARDPASEWLVERGLGYVDLSAFQVIEGLRYAFPHATAASLARTPRLAALAERVRRLPPISAYLASERRLKFNEQGIFRAYKELDEPGI